MSTCHFCQDDPRFDGSHHWCHVYAAITRECPCGQPLDHHPAPHQIEMTT